MRRSTVRTLSLGALALVAVLAIPATMLGLRVHTARAVPAPCLSPWRVVSSTNTGTDSNLLERVAVISPNEAWAAGSVFSFQTGAGTPLVEHWANGAWSVAPTPPVGKAGALNALFDVAGTSASDVWTVGSYTDNTGLSQPLAEHWNGSAWSLVAVPGVGTEGGALNGVATLASNNAWAVGSYFDTTLQVSRTLIEHWDGTKWNIIPSANVASLDTELGAVSIVSATDIWAVGLYIPASGPAYDTLIEHWNGTSWSIVPSPNSASGTNDQNELLGLAAVTSSDVWSVGATFTSATKVSQTLIEHWNGMSWSIVPSPNPGGMNDALHDVTAATATDVIAVGRSAVSSTLTNTLIEQWNGTAWTVVPSPNVATTFNNLVGVGAYGPGMLWAVGSAYSGTSPRATLTMRSGSFVPALRGPSVGGQFACPLTAASHASQASPLDQIALRRLAESAHGSQRALYRRLAAMEG